MFSRTFAISAETKIIHLMTEACRFWGFEIADCELFYENPGNPKARNGIEVIDRDEYEWKVTTILNQVTFADDKEGKKKEEKAYSTFYIG